MNTIVLEKDENGNEYPISVFSKMVKSRTIFLNHDIDEQNAVDIVATMLHLKSEKSKDPTINIFINAYSMDVRSVLMITDIFKNIGVPTRVVVTGECSGAATMLLAAADKAQATENSLILLGPILLAPGARLVEDSERLMKRVKADHKNMMTLVSKKIKKPLKETIEMFSKDVYMSAKEALKLGLIDSIIGTK